MKTSALFVSAGFVMLALDLAPAFSHGAMVEGAIVPGISVQAAYDSGEPMAGAQITVFAPSDPARPWLTGVSDDQGRFSFVPDPQDHGLWAVQARQAGHGAIFHVRTAPPGESAAAAVSQGGLDPLQRTIAAGAVVWGFIGTALFFWRRRRGDAHS